MGGGGDVGRAEDVEMWCCGILGAWGDGGRAEDGLAWCGLCGEMVGWVSVPGMVWEM